MAGITSIDNNAVAGSVMVVSRNEREETSSLHSLSRNILGKNMNPNGLNSKTAVAV